MRPILLLLFASFALPAAAQDAPQPRPRPDAAMPAEGPAEETEEPAAEAPGPEAPTTPDGDPLPRPRPDAPTETQPPAETAAPPSQPAEEATQPDENAGPAAEEAAPGPPRVYQTACPAVIMGLVEAEALPPISEGQCREQSPLSVTSVLVNGRMVPLSAPATVNCEMAMILPDWAEAVEGFAWARYNARLAGITVGTSYMCRARNSAESGFVSEHGFADALDVVGFSFEDGRTVDVQSGWNGTQEQGSRIIRFAHDAACSRFTTTLGPEANAEHADHLHLDMGCHGEACTARLCE